MGPEMATNEARAISGPTKVEVFRAHPFNGPRNGFACIKFIKYKRHIKNRYVGKFSYIRFQGPRVSIEPMCVHCSVARWPEFQPKKSKGAKENVVGREKWWPNFSRFLSKVTEKGPENFFLKKVTVF